jgi:pyrimidine operon attenuation protein/uracil phosphoribosyltransferase
METCSSVINAVLICVSYTLASLTYRVKEKSQTILECESLAVWKRGVAWTRMLKDSLQREESVEIATNKVTFCGTQNDTVRYNQEMILRRYSLNHLPANAHKISYKN